jgi:uncharacterized protein (DUF362 family)
MRRMDRRDFLRHGTLAAGGLGLGAVHLGEAVAQEAAKSKVAAIASEAVQPAAGRLNKGVVLQMLDAGVVHATGEETPDAAWGSLFANDDVVAIKVNASGGPLLSTNRTVVDAIVARLAGIGISTDNIAIYDRTNGALAACGYALNSSVGVKCGGVEGHWGEKRIRQGAFSGRLADLLNYVSAIVNVPILKDAPVGITISLKNHFGTIEKPSECHGNDCDPYIADVNAIPAIRDKQRLVVCDATSACYEGGPGADPRYIWRPNRLLVATDPVALDTVGMAMIDAKRQQQALPTLAAAGRKPKQLASAAARDLGTDDPSQIDLLEKTL